MITYGKTTYTEGYEPRTTLKVGTMRGSARKLAEAEAGMYQPTLKEVWGGLVVLACILVGCLITLAGVVYSVAWAVEKVLRGFGL